MADFDVTVKKISTKVQMLKIARNECYRLLQGNKIKKLETHLKIFEERLEELKNTKSKVQEFREEKRRMLEKNGPIEEWSSKREAEIQENDALIEEHQNRITELKERENKERRAEEDQIEEECLKRRYDEEKRLEIVKIELRQTFEQKNEGNSDKQSRENPVKIKLPKLTISKFEGADLDWLRFWSQFETEIDRADIITVSKF